MNLDFDLYWKKIQNDDEYALEIVYKATFRSLVNYASEITGQVQLAEEGGTLEPKFENSIGNESKGYTPWGYLATNCSEKPRPFPNVWLRIKKVGNIHRLQEGEK